MTGKIKKRSTSRNGHLYSPYRALKVERRFRLWRKKQERLETKRERRTFIVSFRIRDSERHDLQKDMRANPAAGVKSLKQFARKLAVDYAQGRLVYVDLLDRKVSPDSRPPIQPPNCQMSGRRFLQSLKRFLNTEENWRKLRFFMLPRSGWPEEFYKAYNEAEDDQDRLVVAQKFINKMLKTKI